MKKWKNLKAAQDEKLRCIITTLMSYTAYVKFIDG
jgi:hypothetical protein